MLLAKFVWTLAEIAGEIFYGIEVKVESCEESNCGVRVLPPSAFVVGSCELPLRPTIYRLLITAPSAHAQRPPRQRLRSNPGLGNSIYPIIERAGEE